MENTITLEDLFFSDEIIDELIGSETLEYIFTELEDLVVFPEN